MPVRIFIIILLLTKALFSQTADLKLLYNTLNVSKEDSLKVNILNDIGWELRFNNPDTAIFYSTQALLLSEKLNWKQGCANSLGQLGTYHRLKSENAKAFDFYFKGLELNQELKNKKGIATALGNIGFLYKEQSDFTKALDFLLKALKIDEEIGNKKGVARHNINIGTVYHQQTNYDKALEYYLKALKIDEELGNLNSVAMIYGNIGSLYGNKKNFQDALKYHQKALSIFEQLNNKNGIATELASIGNVFENQGDYKKALENYLKALSIFQSIDYKYAVAIYLANTGNLYNKMGQYKEAEKYLLAAIDLAKTINALDELRQSEEFLSMLYENIGKHKLALEHFRKASILKDSIFSLENKNEIVRKEMNFEFEKQQAITEAKHKNEIEKEQTIAQEKSRRQNVIILSVAIVLFLVLIFAVFIYKSLNIARKQKNIIEHQKHMIEEKHKEITDSINYAERIQRSFLATKNLLDDNLKNYFVFFQPKDVVSGDFYWASKLNNDQFVLATADSTGHGVPGAIMSILNISSLEKAIESDTEPDEILNKTRDIIIKRLKKDGSLEGGKDGMDCSLICFDFKNNIFTYSAANNPVWIIRNSELIELAADKMPVGKHFHENTPFAKHSFILQKGDLIYTLTDGMPDQFGGLNGKKFKYKQLKELLLSVSSEPLDIQYQTIKKTFYNWKGNLEQIDDVTIIGIQI